ncbi:MAG: hypothetical protein WD993_03460 [Thermoleophilaceae bacterium]
MRNLSTLRTLVCALLAMVAVLALPAAADASPRQLSLMQDDAELFAEQPHHDAAAAMREMRDLGVDVLRTNVLFYRVYREYNDRVKPGGFDTSDPSEPLYNWVPTDRIVNLARQHGIQVMLTISGPGPHWASQQPRRCRRGKLCTWKPDPKEFGAFAAAVAKRYQGRVDWYSLYNEPNLTTWITPQIKRTRFGRVELAGVFYRKLWLAGYKSIRRHDPARRNRVLFGEVAAIGGPIPKLYAALCLDADGRPFRGRMRKLHRCGGRIARLNIGGWAVHPYNQGGLGSPRRTTRSKTALPQQYMPRLHRLMKRAAAKRRVRGGRGIYITEFGYQTRPPDPISNISPRQQAQYINESDRLFFGDRRIKAVGQYQLVDVEDRHQYNSGLRFANGRAKPALDAYRLPLVVTRRGGNRVEVWGQVRPASVARAMGSFTRPEVQVRLRSRGFKTVARPNPNAVGIFRLNKRGRAALRGRWRVRWENPIAGGVSVSRVARAGKPLRYYRD